MPTVLDKMILRQGLQAGRIDKTLREQESRRHRQLMLLLSRPPMDVLQDTRQSGFLQGFLEILVSIKTQFCQSGVIANAYVRRHVPPDELVQNFDVLLHVIHLGRLLCVEDGERRHGGAIVDVAAAGLDEPSDEYDLEQRIGIFEQFKCRPGLDEFSRESFKVAFRDGFEVFVELVSEDYPPELSVSDDAKVL